MAPENHGRLRSFRIVACCALLAGTGACGGPGADSRGTGGGSESSGGSNSASGGSSSGGSAFGESGGSGAGALGSGGSATSGGSASGGSGAVPNGDVSVTISPATTSLILGNSVQFTATVTGSSNTDVTFSVEEGADGGSVDAEGAYTAPGQAGTYHVIATSVADSSATDRATITVSPAASSEPGVWEHVTPAGLDMSPSSFGGGNFGAQDVFVDPANPNELYLSACYQGIWKSTDYGLTWAKVSTDGGPMDLGRPWAVGIERDPDREPSTPPILYSTQGYGPEQGFWRSTNGGVDWTHFDMGDDNDTGSMSVDPNDANHVIAGMRASTHVLETTNGGEDWTDRGAAGTKNSNHVYFVTSSTWLLVSEWGDGSDGTKRTTDSGATWNKVSTCERFHGSSQPYFGDNGLIVAPCVEGIKKSTDYGATWSDVAEGASSAIAGTATYLYVATGWATQGEWDVNPRRAELGTGATSWTSYTTQPEAMTNGPHRVAVTFDGEKYVIVSANWLGGIWRYVEP